MTMWRVIWPLLSQLTLHDKQSLLECIQFVRRTAVQTAVHVITTATLIALLTGIAMKLRWFGPN